MWWVLKRTIGTIILGWLVVLIMVGAVWAGVKLADATPPHPTCNVAGVCIPRPNPQP